MPTTSHAPITTKTSSVRWMPALALAAAASLAPPLSAQAHDIVLVPEAGGVRVRMGHPADWQPVDGERLLELQVVDGDGRGVDRQAALKRKGLDLLLSGRAAGSAPSLVAARYDNGLWVQLPAAAGGAGKPQWRNSGRFMTPGTDSVMASLKFAKAFVRAGGGGGGGGGGDDDGHALYGRRVGHLLELVPQKNPLTLKAGETLPMLVLLNGKPLEGAGVEVGNLIDQLPEDRVVRHTTDATGVAQVPLRPRGVNRLAVDVERPNDGGLGETAKKSLPADKVLMVATYTFVR